MKSSMYCDRWVGVVIAMLIQLCWCCDSYVGVVTLTAMLLQLQQLYCADAVTAVLVQQLSKCSWCCCDCCFVLVLRQLC